MNKKIRVGIDVDNVIVDFTSRFTEEFNKITGKTLNRNDLHKWNLKDVINELYNGEIDGEISNELLFSGVLFDDLRFKDNAKEALDRMNLNQSIDIVIITALDESLKEKRINWFKEELPHIKCELHFESKKSTVHEKKPIDYLIDDGLHNLDELSKYIPIENCLCIEEPYNKSSIYPRFKNLEEAYNYILKKENLNDII